jgi:hypothetical protein
VPGALPSAAPTALVAKECPTVGINWITMSLEARNLACNKVEHGGPENARKKTEDWAAASKTLREQRPKHLASTPGVLILFG